VFYVFGYFGISRVWDIVCVFFIMDEDENGSEIGDRKGRGLLGGCVEQCQNPTISAILWLHNSRLQQKKPPCWPIFNIRERPKSTMVAWPIFDNTGFEFVCLLLLCV
jgi:hypothetical protein